jgi:hypothetical protein
MITTEQRLIYKKEEKRLVLNRHITKSDGQEAILRFRHVKGDPGFKFRQGNLLF